VTMFRHARLSSPLNGGSMFKLMEIKPPLLNFNEV
jgi:hypothetical protein